jgi:phage-related protein
MPGQAVTQANLGQQQAAALQASGAAQQGHEQQIIDEQMANWQAAYNQPYQNLDTLLASVGAVPYGTSTTGTGGSSTTQKTDPGLLNTIGAYVGFASKLGSTAASAVKG